MFAQDLKVDVSGEEIPYDTSHIYTGEIYGKTVPLLLMYSFLYKLCSQWHLSDYVYMFFLNPLTLIRL